MNLLQTIHGPDDLKRLAPDQLPQLAHEIRHAIIEQIRTTGGHLAPNLGVVELTIALHYVFDFSWDRLLFDVGHQCYPHKLLTGRLHLLDKLRTRDGMAGFPEPRESPFDLFSVGHAGTGISTAVGVASGDTRNGEGFHPTLKPDGRRAAVLIGDASIVNGVAMEGLNAAGTLGRQFLIILNDNGMSISRPQGALAHYFDRLRLSHTYSDFKRQARSVLDSIPGGGLLRDAYHWAGEAAKQAMHGGGELGSGWFEGFGIKTAGPIDGHDLPTLIQYFREASTFDRPLVLHVKTVKGKGYAVAERDSSTFHSPAPFKVAGDPDGEDCRVEIASEGRSFTAAAGDAIRQIMDRDPRVIACTAAMPDGTGLSRVSPVHPDRVIDTGICESHAMDMMAGLARTGWKPFFFVYSTFLQRAFDQAFQEVALQGLPVRLCLDRAGLVGGDGAVHHGFCDVAILRTLPRAALLAAADEPSLKAAMEFMLGYTDGLSAVRYPRDVVSDRLAGLPPAPFVLGKARCLTPRYQDLAEAPDVAVVAYGTPAVDALEAAAMLAEDFRVAVWDARFAKPVDADLVRALLSRGVPVLTVEDHSLIGGFGSAVLESAAEQGLDASRLTRLALPDRWIFQDSRSRQLAEVGLNAAGIAASIRRWAEHLGLTPSVGTASPSRATSKA
ncbi:MAG: 1-deoxy-D-xylulose-5-phosphate synthase [Phycisphaeraceae bacterium]|nr:MAG: 1-deoxy-D-xylulose-5-phosphate synthase [Phycisphaeraceae bacterium]